MHTTCTAWHSYEALLIGSSLHSHLILQVERNAQLQQLQDVLTSLWEATNSTGVQQEQRPAYQDLVTSATRLHAGTLDKLQAEVRRLELCRAQAMRDLTMAKARELQAACAEARMPVPELPVLLAEMGRRTGPGDTAAAPNPGQVRGL
jgi:protein regulator of cytokinesis 1